MERHCDKPGRNIHEQCKINELDIFAYYCIKPLHQSTKQSGLMARIACCSHGGVGLFMRQKEAKTVDGIKMQLMMHQEK